MRYRTAIIALLFFILTLAAPVSAQPIAFPHRFYGDVTIGGEAAPLGTVVSAKVNGVESGNVTTWERGKYGWGYPGVPEYDYQYYLLVQGDHISTNDTIEFFVNGVKADQTSTFQSYAKTSLDLTAASVPVLTPTPTVTPTPTPTPTPTTTPPPDGGGGLSGGAVAGIVVASLIAGALIAWLIMRRR